MLNSASKRSAKRSPGNGKAAQYTPLRKPLSKPVPSPTVKAQVRESVIDLGDRLFGPMKARESFPTPIKVTPSARQLAPDPSPPQSPVDEDSHGDEGCFRLHWAGEQAFPKADY